MLPIIIDPVIPVLRTHPKEIMQKMPKASHVKKFILVLTRRAKTRNDPNGH